MFVLVVGGWPGLGLDLGSGKAVGLRLGPALGHVSYIDASIGVLASCGWGELQLSLGVEACGPGVGLPLLARSPGFVHNYV